MKRGRVLGWTARWGILLVRIGSTCYRSAGGEPKRLLIDSLVGAHAQERADRLLTLDPQRYRSAFGDLRIEP